MKKSFLKLNAIAGAVLLLASCSHDPNSPGVEYMPDMYRSPAVEAYIDYDNIEESSTRKPVDGTIKYSKEGKAWINMPYAYPATTEGYELAGTELTSPLAMDEMTVAKGQDLYTKFCMHCHGESGMGDGAVVTNGGFPPPPAYNGALKNLPEGKMFHTITYGKGVMGSHASQLNKEERWQVIQYIKVLQNDGEMPVVAEASVVE
jgi:mono/diheme cytochrome c family protein